MMMFIMTCDKRQCGEEKVQSVELSAGLLVLLSTLMYSQKLFKCKKKRLKHFGACPFFDRALQKNILFLKNCTICRYEY